MVQIDTDAGDFRIQWWGPTEKPEKILKEYITERQLRHLLLTSGPQGRGPLYAAAYEEVIRRSFEDIDDRHREIERDISQSRAAFRALKPYVRSAYQVAEIGPGHGRVSRLLSRVVTGVTMVDVRSALEYDTGGADNLRLLVTDGTRAPLPQGSLDLIYSDQLIEHLHVDDAIGIFTDAHEALRRGGKLIIYTPNRLLGPHDLSRYFDRSKSDGLHLVEYSLTELMQLLQRAGFRKFRALVGGRWIWIPAPMAPLTALEAVVDRLPPERRMRLIRTPALKQALKMLLGARMIASKA